MTRRADVIRELSRRIREVLYHARPTSGEKHRAREALAMLEALALEAESERTKLSSATVSR